MSIKTILGIDLGTNSLGTALLARNERNQPCAIQHMGVRIFEAGMDGNLDDGTQKSKNLQRRDARMMRKQHDRRARRMKKLMRALQEAGLLPAQDNMAAAIEAIDQAVFKRLKMDPREVPHLAHVIPYRLRSLALDIRLNDFELGRALYHLGQRRGFLSNRKSIAKEEDSEKGKVKSGISELNKKMEDSNSRTLGDFFGGINSEEERIRGRYTGRKMFINEFRDIINVQRNLGNQKLTDDVERKLHHAIFFQRPLKSCAKLVGFCSYEKNERRCPWFYPEAQLFRLYQLVNNLRLTFTQTGENRPLTTEEREKLLQNLLKVKTLKITEAKKLLGFTPRSNPVRFSIEEGDEKNLPGHAVNAHMIPFFGELWFTFPPEKQLEILLEINSFEKEEALKKRAMKAWNLDEDSATTLSTAALPSDYAALSLKAIRKILPAMQCGTPYMTALQAAYPALCASTAIYEFLPPVKTWAKNLRNPIVERALTQLRHIVNAYIRQYGKPDAIHIELAREMKRSVAEKKSLTKKMRAREQDRAAAKEALKKLGIIDLKPFIIEKYLLWQECEGVCPYTGKEISPNNLFGENPDFDVEHIIPYSISLDDSFANKTLCHADFNRRWKRTHTPFQCLSAHPGHYEETLARVDRFKGTYREEKLRRFKLENLEEFADFTNRHLNDTRHASILAKEYLSLLYGGTCDADGHQRITAPSGGITAKIRNYYKLNSILGKETEKNRFDHRHHAIDALALALTTQRTIQSIREDAAEWEPKNPRLMYQGKDEPWEGFLNETRRTVGGIHVTHCIPHKTRGPMHEETVYGETDTPGKVSYRVPLTALKPNDLENITDPQIKACVTAKLIEFGIAIKPKMTTDAEKKAWAKAVSRFETEENLPRVTSKKGSIGPLIKSVRCQKPQETTQIGEGDNQRRVILGNNHHIEILAYIDKKGNERWEGKCVSIWECYRRKRENQPIIQRDHGPGKRFAFSLAKGDIIQCKMEGDAEPQLYVIRVIPQSLQIAFVPLKAAGEKKDLQSEARKEWKTKTIASLRETGAVKVTLSPLGEIRHAND